MKITVITVAYKDSKEIINLLNSIQKYNDIGDDLEVIIVDNSPEEERIEEQIKVANYKNYKYIPADNRGFGAGNNIGAAVARGEILAFLNPDIILIEPIFRKICEKFGSEERVDWIGGQLYDEYGQKGVSYGLSLEFQPQNILTALWKRVRNTILPYEFDDKTMFLAGADMIVRKSFFNLIGKFDENIFMYGEEPDFAYRIRKADKDYKMIFCPDISMIHIGEHSTKQNFEWKEKIRFASNMYVLKKHDLDYKRIWKSYYQLEKKKYYIDSVFRPEIAKNRRMWLDVYKKCLLEFLNV